MHAGCPDLGSICNAFLCPTCVWHSGTVYEMVLGYCQEKRTEEELVRRNVQDQIEQDAAVQVVQMADLGAESDDIPAPNGQEQAMSLL